MDAFEVATSPKERRSCEQLVRAGLEGAPAVMRWFIVLAHRWVLTFRLRPLGDPGAILGWAVASEAPDAVVLTARGPLMDGVLVLRRTTADSVRLSTHLRYRRRRMAALVWRVVGPAHRRIAPYLMTRAVR